MSQSPFGRVAGYVLGPPIEFVGRRVERRVNRAVSELPEPPWWAAPVVVVAGLVGAVVVELGSDPRDAAGQSSSRRVSERAEPEPEATAERGTTSEAADGPDEQQEADETPVEDALETLGVEEYPPMPEKSEVKSAYRALAVETHPDQGGDAERFIAVREAWETVAEREELSAGGVDAGGN